MFYVLYFYIIVDEGLIITKNRKRRHITKVKEIVVRKWARYLQKILLLIINIVIGVIEISKLKKIEREYWFKYGKER